MLKTLNKLFALDPLVAEFYKSIDPPKEFIDAPVIDAENNSKNMLFLINRIANHDGLLKWADTASDKILNCDESQEFLQMINEILKVNSENIDVNIIKRCEKMLMNSYLEKYIGFIADKPPASFSQETDLFFNFFLNDAKFPSANANSNNFMYFKRYFISQNISDLTFEIEDGKINFRKSHEIIGFKKLISIFLESDDNYVVQECLDMIWILMTKFHVTIYHNSSRIFNEFINEIIDDINKHRKTESVVNRGLSLLLKFVEKKEPVSSNCIMYAKCENDVAHKSIEINNNSVIKDLRKEIAKVYGQPIENVIITANDRHFGPAENDMKISSLNSIAMTVSFIEPQIFDYEPRENLANNSKLYDFIFELVSDSQKYSDLAWTLLLTLPTFEHLAHEIFSLNSRFSQILSPNNHFKLLYCFFILYRFCGDENWRQKLINVDGLGYLIKLFIFIKENITGKSTIKLQEMMVNILNKIIRFPISSANVLMETLLGSL